MITRYRGTLNQERADRVCTSCANDDDDRTGKERVCDALGEAVGLNGEGGAGRGGSVVHLTEKCYVSWFSRPVSPFAPQLKLPGALVE